MLKEPTDTRYIKYLKFTETNSEDKWMKEVELNLPFPNKSFATLEEEEFLQKIKEDNEWQTLFG